MEKGRGREKCYEGKTEKDGKNTEVKKDERNEGQTDDREKEGEVKKDGRTVKQRKDGETEREAIENKTKNLLHYQSTAIS